MPNHVVNELIFRNLDADTERRLIANLCDADGKVDFQILVPMPVNMWWGSVGARHEVAFKRTALDWRRENWGTKWNAYEQRPIERVGGALIIRFDTAWTPPYPWLAAIFNTFKISFDHNWLSEGGGRGHHAVFDATKTEGMWDDPWREEEADDAMHRHLHFLRWGVEEFAEEDEAE